MGIIGLVYSTDARTALSLFILRVVPGKAVFAPARSGGAMLMFIVWNFIKPCLLFSPGYYLY